MSKVDELIRELCPDGVQRVALGEVAKYVRGLTYRKSDEVSEGGVPVLRANNITLGSNRLNQDDLKRVSDHLTISEDKILGAGDTLICAGSGSKEHVGKVAFSEEDTRYAFGGFMAVIRSMSPAINPRFLFHNLSSKYFRDYLDRVLSTSTINNLNARIVEAFSIPLLPLELQEEIVRILDQFMELDRELEQEITGREAQRRALRARYFECVSGYDLVPLRDLGQLITGRTPTKADRDSWGDEFDFVTPGDISEDAKLIGETSRSLSESGAKKFDRIAVGPNSVLTVCIGASLGKIGIVEKLSFTNQQINSLVVEEGNDPNYVYYALENSQPQLQQLGGVGNSSMPLLNKSAFSAFEIPLPPLEAQQEIANKLDTFTEYIDNLKRERELRQKQYEYYRDQLLDFSVKE